MGHHGQIRDFTKSGSLIYRLLDISLIMAVLLSVLAFYQAKFNLSYAVVALLAVVVYTITSESLDLYRSWRVSSFNQMCLLTSLAWIVTTLTLILIGYFSKLGVEYSRLVVGWWFLLSLLVLNSWRAIYRLYQFELHRRGINTKSAIVIGATEQGIRLMEGLISKPELGIEVKGFYDDRVRGRLPEELPMEIRGTVEQALKLAKKGVVQHVYIALPLHANERIAQILCEFADTTVNTYLVPDFFTYNLLHSRWGSVGDIHTLSVFDTPFNGVSSWIKRAEDIVLSTIILSLISPLLIAIAVGVKLTSSGPIFFKQDRYGLDGRKIKVWKFRSMKTMENGAKVVQATKNDPRVTRFGGFLRRTSLDELPQFINVIQGRMSIVGPRPHAVAHNEEYRVLVERYMLRHKVKPGITGLAQINGWRGETDTLEKMEKRVQYDLDYIQRWSLWLDIKIVVLTIFKGFVSKTAY